MWNKHSTTPQACPTLSQQLQSYRQNIYVFCSLFRQIAATIIIVWQISWLKYPSNYTFTCLRCSMNFFPNRVSKSRNPTLAKRSCSFRVIPSLSFPDIPRKSASADQAGQMKFTMSVNNPSNEAIPLPFQEEQTLCREQQIQFMNKVIRISSILTLFSAKVLLSLKSSNPTFPSKNDKYFPDLTCFILKGQSQSKSEVLQFSKTNTQLSLGLPTKQGFPPLSKLKNRRQAQYLRNTLEENWMSCSHSRFSLSTGSSITQLTQSLMPFQNRAEMSSVTASFIAERLLPDSTLQI